VGPRTHGRQIIAKKENGTGHGTGSFPQARDPPVPPVIGSGRERVSGLCAYKKFFIGFIAVTTIMKRPLPAERWRKPAYGAELFKRGALDGENEGSMAPDGALTGERQPPKYHITGRLFGGKIGRHVPA
jgi:hypothetical protein